jgi:hypothetical protein
VIVVRGPPFATVLAGQHMNDDTNGVSNCTADEDTTPPWALATAASGSVDCDDETAPLMEGAQKMRVVTVGGGAAAATWDGAHDNVTSGAWVVEFDQSVLAENPAGASSTWQRARDDGGYIYPQAWSRASDNLYRWYCGAAGSPRSVDWNYSLPGAATIRWEFHVTNGPGRCVGPGAGCTDCGCLWVDDVQIGWCDSTSHSGDPDGIHFGPSADTFNADIDGLHLCSSVPPPGTRCGDGLGLTF